jgi:hypothetical protein
MKGLSEFTSEDIQRVVDRLAKARWIDRAGVFGYDFVLDFSTLGNSRMREFARQFRAAAPEMFGLPGKRALRIGGKIRLGWLGAQARSELRPLSWKKVEGQVFTCLLARYAQSPEMLHGTSLSVRFRSQAPPSSL